MDTRQDDLLTIAEVCDILQLSPRTLLNLRHRGQRPAALRVGDRGVRYRRSEIEAYLAAREDMMTGECIEIAALLAEEAEVAPVAPAVPGEVPAKRTSPSGVRYNDFPVVDLGPAGGQRHRTTARSPLRDPARRAS